MTTSATSPQSRWVAYRRPAPGARLRLLCFHHAGGGASLFREWAKEMPQGVEVLPVQLPGREARMNEPPHRSVADLVPALAEGIEGFRDLPVALFGHSMGSLVAFELARHLAARGEPAPVHLFASGRRGPSVPDPRPRMLHNLSDAEFVEEIRRLGGTPDEVLADAEIVELLLPLVRADFQLCDTYEYLPGQPLRSPITALGGTDDPDVSPEQLEAWGRETAGPFGMRLFPGGHFYLGSDPRPVRREIASRLEAALRAL